MPHRIVISFRGTLAQDTAGGAAYLDRALSLKKRAEAHGATLCAWSASSFAFAFDPDEIEEALTLASLVFEDVVDAGGLPRSQGALPPPKPLAKFGAGVAEGEMSQVGERGSLAGLAWGLPLVTAFALSRAAGSGEVLVAEDLFARRASEIAALGFRGEGDHIRRLVRTTAEPSDDSVPVDIVPDLERTPSSQRPDAVTEIAKRALLQGDVDALERLIAELRASGEHVDLVERMSGFVALRRGATADALRRLRAAAEAVTEPGQRARARLAYGVALASAGRTESALLEALEALARAREATDLHGEHACALFLARLSARAGHPDAASVWARVAARAEAAYPAG